jgi:DNA polymerase-3 subunit delta'
MAKRPAAKVVERTLGTAPDPDAPPANPISRLDQIVGNTRALDVLQSAMHTGRVHHAWIFHGPVGVGKKTAAVAFAAAILDPTLAPDLSGQLAIDPDSQVQQLVRAGNHPDLHVITKELAAISREQRVRDSKQTSISNEVVNEFLIEPAARSRVYQSHGQSIACKVFIIDEAELMNHVTQNVVLKTLEEPPEGTVLILVTSSEDRLLPTIRSRCQRVGFTPLSDAHMLKWLAQNAPDISGGKRDWLLKFAQGAPGLAALAIEHDLFAWQQDLGPKLDAVISGSYPSDLAGTMAKLIGDRAEAAVKANPDASKDGANKSWARRMLAFIAEDLRSRIRARVKAGSAADDPALRRVIGAMEAVTQAEFHLNTNVNLALLLDNMVAQMSLEPESIVA